MKNSESPEQLRLNEIQALYRQWLQLQEPLQQAQEIWQQSVDIMKQLEQFYEQEYMPLLQKTKEGLPLNLHTQGEYSVLSEDAVWNAMFEQTQMAWYWVRSALKVLDTTQEQEQ